MLLLFKRVCLYENMQNEIILCYPCHSYDQCAIFTLFTGTHCGDDGSMGAHVCCINICCANCNKYIIAHWSLKEARDEKHTQIIALNKKKSNRKLELNGKRWREMKIFTSFFRSVLFCCWLDYLLTDWLWAGDGIAAATTIAATAAKMNTK